LPGWATSASAFVKGYIVLKGFPQTVLGCQLVTRLDLVQEIHMLR